MKVNTLIRSENEYAYVIAIKSMDNLDIYLPCSAKAKKASWKGIVVSKIVPCKIIKYENVLNKKYRFIILYKYIYIKKQYKLT